MNFVEQIVKNVMQKLDHVYPTKIRGLVGVEQNCAAVESLLANNSSKVQVLGHWDIGGIGKTSLALVFIDKIRGEFLTQRTFFQIVG